MRTVGACRHLLRGAVVIALSVVGCVLGSGCARAQDAEAPAPVQAETVDEIAAAREKLIQRLIRLEYLKTKSVISAMRVTERHWFVPEDVQRFAYEDTPLPIGYD